MSMPAYIRGVATLKLDRDACTGCGLCAVVCPHRVFAVESKKALILDRDLCMECGACEMNCPSGALTVDRGVGCAQAVLTGWRKGGAPDCGCGDDPSCCS